MTDKGIGYGGAFAVGVVGSIVAILPQILIATSYLEKKIDKLIPVVREEQILGSSIPDKFYVIGGRHVYFEIDRKPIEEHIRTNEYNEQLDSKCYESIN